MADNERPHWHFEDDGENFGPQKPLASGEVESFIQAARDATRASRLRNLAQTRDEERPDGQGFGYSERFGE